MIKTSFLLVGICCIVNAIYLGIQSSQNSQPRFCILVSFLSFIIGMLCLINWKEKDESATP